MDSPAFQALLTAAGGKTNVEGFCTNLLASAHPGDNPSGNPGAKPSDLPTEHPTEHPTGRPSEHPTGAPNPHPSH